MTDTSPPPPDPSGQSATSSPSDDQEGALLEALAQGRVVAGMARLAGGVAHDLNNLLTAIQGYCELILLGHGQDAALAADIQEIQGAAARVGTLSRHLLAYSRMPPVHPEPLLLGEVVQEMEDRLRGILGEGIELHLDLEGDQPQALVDRFLLQEIVAGLVRRARVAMAGVGAVTLRAGVEELPEPIGEGGGRGPARRYATLMVADTGSPPDPGLGGRLFEPYFSIKDPDLEASLALPMACRRVQHCQGFLTAEATATGAAFTVHLPSTVEPPA